MAPDDAEQAPPDVKSRPRRARTRAIRERMRLTGEPWTLAARNVDTERGGGDTRG